METFRNVMRTILVVVVVFIIGWIGSDLESGNIRFKYCKPSYYDFKTDMIYVDDYDDIQYYTLKELVDHHKTIKEQGFMFNEVVFH